MTLQDFDHVPPTPEETAMWQAYLAKQERAVEIELPIPYAFPLGAVNIAGILYLRTPVEESYTEGVAIGVVNGNYKLDRSNTSATLYDPTTLIKIELKLEFSPGILKARICSRTLTGGWSCSGWTTLASW